MRLDEGWNQIQFNLSDFTRRAYGTNYIETVWGRGYMLKDYESQTSEEDSLRTRIVGA
jgi:hypothetical protein